MQYYYYVIQNIVVDVMHHDSKKSALMEVMKWCRKDAVLFALMKEGR